MAMGRYLVFSLAIFCGFSFLSSTLFAQLNDDQIAWAVTQRDSLFWLAYNNCDTVAFSGFFTDDVEFYHDKGGLTRGINAVLSSLKRNLCTGEFQMRRDAVEGTVHVFPLRNGAVPYGAILIGEHIFSRLRNGKIESVDALAKFTHVWLLEGGSWKMSRILSYDHKSAPYLNKRNEISLPVSTLDRCVGRYAGRTSGDVLVKRGDGSLVIVTNGKEFAIYPATATTFFSKDRDLTFDFVDVKTTNARIVVRENGSIVDELHILK